MKLHQIHDFTLFFVKCRGLIHFILDYLKHISPHEGAVTIETALKVG